MNFLETPLFGILLSLMAFEIGVWVNAKTKWALLNPLLLAIGIVISFLLLTGVSLETYNLGGDYISFFLSPATVVLALPLYKQLARLKENWLPIFAGICAGTFSSIGSVIFLSKMFSVSKEIILSLVPKSITTPMGIEVAKELGGDPGIAVAAIMVTGITGAIVGPIVCRVCRIVHPIAIGVALGTNSHAVGTSRAMELGEIQGATSSLSIGIAGVIASVSAPFLVPLFL